jgi:hypothetical protein
MRRGQLSMDFLVIVIFAFIVFLSMFQIYADQTNYASITEGRVSALRVGSIIARTINEVLKANGTSALAVIPGSLDTSDTYFVSINGPGRRVDIFWPISSTNKSLGVPILTSNMTGLSSLSKTAGSNQSILNITNINGAINISGS